MLAQCRVTRLGSEEINLDWAAQRAALLQRHCCARSTVLEYKAWTVNSVARLFEGDDL
jgi:hypothetical protein